MLGYYKISPILRSKNFNVFYRTQYSWVLQQVLKDETFQRNCKDAGLSSSMLLDSFKSFKTKLVYKKDKTNFEAMKVQYVLDGILSSKYSHSSIFPLFLKHVKKEIPMLKNHEQLKKMTDLSDPTEWYPRARSMKRSVIFHAGPTNSGKTHAALENFLAANSGIYCCPLRLLAREISEKSKLRNVPCSLITGEERKYVEDSTHTACTVEMTNLNTRFDVAVIDEIQIIGDQKRGWAWTRALLGVCANEIHVCGEPRAISIVRKLCNECDDDLEVREYERLTELRVKKYSVDSFDRIKNGDCVVCFSRKDIYATVSKLAAVGKDAAVIYGKLPPSTKRKEANKFNKLNDKHNILVATDAIGMGLNLNIKRIVFNSIVRRTRNEKGNYILKKLTTPEALQISGRAGRFGFQESGEVTTMYKKDISSLHELLLNTKQDITHAGIIPTLDYYLLFSKETKSLNLYNILGRFDEMCTINHKLFQMCSQTDLFDLAKVLQDFDLPIEDSYKFSLCPINSEIKISLDMFKSFVKLFSECKQVSYDIVVKLLSQHGVMIPFLPTDKYDTLMVLENVHNVLGGYLWLCFQFPDHFPNYKEVFEMRSSLENVITLSLKNIQNRFPGRFNFPSKKRKKIRQK